MGRGRGQPGGNDSGRGQGPRRGRGRGRGRGDAAPRGTGQTVDITNQPQPRAVEAVDQAGSDLKEEEICFICASPVVHYAVASCNHRTCHICSLRLRALYKTKACAHCRNESPRVIFTDDGTKKFDDFERSQLANRDDNLGIDYDSEVIFEDTVLLLRYNCPDPTCDVACLGWPDLHRHVKAVHHKSMCDLCTRNKKVFTHEHELFDGATLKKHEKFGDDNPGAVDQSGFKGHPECGFCRRRFYGDDELYTHCRDRHERCHICDRRSPRLQQQYFVDYNSLESHFQKVHHPCLEKDCLEKKFVVFESEMDLKAHQLDTHGQGLSKDARRVDMAGFDYRMPHQRDTNRRDQHQRREPLPQSTAQPLRRDELAYQRQMAIQNTQTVPTRTFGGQLTPAAPTRPIPSQDVPPGLNTASDAALALRHAAVTSRAATLVKNDAQKMSTFRQKVSSFRTSEITATLLIETFFALFDCPARELGKLIRDLADLYDETKRKELLKAWNDWRAVNEDYPALPRSSGVLPNTASGGRRVLNLKNSTGQSSRSPVSRNESWGSAKDSETSLANRQPSSVPLPSTSTPRAKPPANSEAFPALPMSKSTASFGYGLGGGLPTNSTPWSGMSSSAASAAASENEAEDGTKKKRAGKKKQVLFHYG